MKVGQRAQAKDTSEFYARRGFRARGAIMAVDWNGNALLVGTYNTYSIPFRDLEPETR